MYSSPGEGKFCGSKPQQVPNEGGSAKHTTAMSFYVRTATDEEIEALIVLPNERSLFRMGIRGIVRQLLRLRNYGLQV